MFNHIFAGKKSTSFGVSAVEKDLSENLSDASLIFSITKLTWRKIRKKRNKMLAELLISNDTSGSFWKIEVSTLSIRAASFVKSATFDVPKSTTTFVFDRDVASNVKTNV